MAQILKYHVEPKYEVQKIEIASGANLVSAIEQNGGIVVYALVDNPYHTTMPKTTKHIFVVGTGWEFDASGMFLEKFIGTVRIGPLVWHVLEVEDQPF